MKRERVDIRSPGGGFLVFHETFPCGQCSKAAHSAAGERSGRFLLRWLYPVVPSVKSVVRFVEVWLRLGRAMFFAVENSSYKFTIPPFYCKRRKVRRVMNLPIKRKAGILAN